MYFDASFYEDQLRRNEVDLPRDLLSHYLLSGWRFGFDPHPEFSTDGYLMEHPDVRAARINPLEHFEAWGLLEDRRTVSVAEYSMIPVTRRILREVDWFSLEHYQSQVGIESFDSVLEGLDHYLASGWREGFDPHPAFSTLGYLHDNWDVRDDGMDPLTHFVHHGYPEGRSVVDPADFMLPDYQTPDSAWIAETRSSLAAYLQHLSIDFDVTVIEYKRGQFIHSDEFRWFDSDFYLRQYNDVAKASVSAFDHFVLAGHREGRFPNSEVVRELALRSDIDRVLLARSWTEGSYETLPNDQQVIDSGQAMVAEMRARGHLDPDRIVIAFAHDDYVENVGGIQLVSAREEALFREMRITYISLFPAVPQLAPAIVGSNGALVRCRVNGELLDRAFNLEDFAEGLSKENLKGEFIVVVHSIFGHSTEAIASLVRSVDPEVLYWWIHDYSAHCQNYRLTRNGVNWCGDPFPESQACQLCTYGAVRSDHLFRVRTLLDGLPWVFVAPSEVAAEQSVGGCTPLPRRPVVLPHGYIERGGAVREPVSADGVLRIAFVGHPVTIKGWNRFMAFVSDVGPHSELFEFFHLGMQNRSVPGVEFVEVHPDPEGRSTTTEALLEHQIDAIINLVDGKETFNFVTYEAMAAGCCVLTSARSGNVLLAAAAEGLLVEVQDEETEFEYDSIVREIRTRRRNDIGEFLLTGLTPQLVRDALHAC